MKVDDVKNMHLINGNDVNKYRTRMKKVAPPPPGAPSSKKPAVTNGDFLRRQEAVAAPPPRQPMSCTPGEDCAFDELLEGRMELEVVLPDRRSVRMTVDRRTPMMDLLVHVATTNKISPSGHTIKVLSEEQHSVLYKPNTPIGSLDVNTVYIVPKTSTDIPVKRMPKLANQPFEQTFRLQVNLPRNQRMVLRVSPRITLAELKRQICNEKELDHSNHHLVHPTQPDTLLDLNSTLDVYGSAEISLMSSSSLRESINSLSTQLIAYPRMYEEERKKKGILRLFSRRRRETSAESNSNGINSRHVSPNRSATLNRESNAPKLSTKRKPAPAPPLPASVQSSSPPLVIQSSSSLNSRPESEISAKTDELGSTVSHSRHSSDSSGYHEPSVFSDCSENKSPEASIVHCSNAISGHETALCREIPISLALVKPLARDLSNLKTVPSCSNTSIISATRKRKAPQPPAPALPEVETPSSPEDLSPVEREAAQLMADDTAASKDGELERDTRARESIEAGELEERRDSELQQESDALEYFEQVLHQSEVLDAVDSSGKENPELLDESRAVHSETEDVLQSTMEIQIESDTDQQHLCTPTFDPMTVTSDTSDSPPVPLDKDILLEETSDMSLIESKSALTDTPSEAIAGCVNNENDADETPFVPNKVECPSTKSSDCTGNLESKRATETNTLSSSSNSCDNISDNEVLMSPSSQRKLVNFAMGCYKSAIPEDIYNDQRHQDASAEKSSFVTYQTKRPRQKAKREILTEAVIHEVPKSYSTSPPNVKIVPFADRNVCEPSAPHENTKRHVHQRCAELSEISTLPLTGRSMSLYNLSPQTKAEPREESAALQKEFETASDSLKRTQSDRDVCQEMPVSDEKSDFIQEQKRLHEEYLKLQSQFISWQKQLLNNQALLQTEHITSHMAFPAFEQYKIELENLPVTFQEESQEESGVEDLKTRSLPRPKSRPLSIKELHRTESPPAFSRKSKSEEIIEPNPSMKQEKAVMSDSGISTEETSDHSNVPSEIVEETTDLVTMSKCQTLPRPVSKPSSALVTTAVPATKTMTLNRQTRPKSQVVSVTIGSWQQRNMTTPDISSATVASSRSMFQSLENIPREQVAASQVVPQQRKNVKDAVKHEDQPDVHRVIEADVRIIQNSTTAKETVQLTTGAPKSTTRKSRDKTDKPASLNTETVSHRQKNELKSPSDKATYSKSTKPLVRLTNMKDEGHAPPALHVLKKWPLPDINEKESSAKPKEQSFWEEITANAKRPTGRSHERVTRAEVDLRKNRVAKAEALKATRVKEVDETAFKVHVTKVNIYGSQSHSADGVRDTKSKQKSFKSPTLPSSSSLPEKSLPFNDELKTVLSKRASTLSTPLVVSTGNLPEPTYAEAKDSTEKVNGVKITTAQNSNSPPPPPPPPVSTMPAIPPAAPIPRSSQLLMERRITGSTTTKHTQPKLTPSVAPREELMLEIRGFGGRQALRKAPVAQSGWHLKVYGSTSAVNS